MTIGRVAITRALSRETETARASRAASAEDAAREPATRAVSAQIAVRGPATRAASAQIAVREPVNRAASARTEASRADLAETTEPATRAVSARAAVRKPVSRAVLQAAVQDPDRAAEQQLPQELVRAAGPALQIAAAAGAPQDLRVKDSPRSIEMTTRER